MYFEHIYERGLAQSSYLVGCQATGEAIVIDPRRDIDIYREIAEREGLRITHVTETHIHADYLSGAPELAAETGARLLLSDEGGADWQYALAHEPLRDGDVIRIGKLRLEVVHTPGHTPEHLSFVLYDPPAGEPPRMMFTGDLLFVGDVGRPDLLEEAAGMADTREPGARALYASLQKLASLPDATLVMPGHGAGSACGKSLGAVPMTTLGFERMVSWAFHAASERDFVEQLLDGQPEPPRYFAMMKRLNRDRSGMALTPRPPQVGAPDSTWLASNRARVQVVDLRPGEVSAADPLRGAINIPMDSGLSTWLGWVLDYDRPIVFVGDDAYKDAALRAAIRIGLDDVAGWISSEALASHREVLGTADPIPQIQPADLQSMVASGAAVLDVRGASEFAAGHVDGAVHIHLGQLGRRRNEVPEGRPLIVHCQGGYRSTIACSLLRRAGIPDVYNLVGGYAGLCELEPAGTAGTTG